MKIEVSDASEYVAAIPEGRRPHVEAVRKLVRRVVPRSSERIKGGMIYFAYQGRAFAAVASEKSSLALYLIELGGRPDLVKRYEAGLAGLDMGKWCIRFQEVDELPIDVIADILRETPAAAVTTKKVKAAKPAKKAASKKVAKKTAAKAKPAKKKAKAKKSAAPSKKRAK
jgi:uncharacterized protein YdhG (YjbR/CyaY superfamily)